MGWLTKFFRGSTHNISEGREQSKPAEETRWNEPSTSTVVIDPLSEFDNEDIDRAIALSLLEEEHRKPKETGKDLHLDEDEQLARAIQESLNVESPPRPHENASPPRPRENSAHPRARENGNANGGNSYQQLPFMFSSGFRTCAGCHNEIGHGRFLSCMGAVWHPECFCCHACNQPIYDYEVALCCFVYQLSSCIGILTLPKKTCSSPCQETIHTIKLVTRSAFIQNVMSASNLFLQI
uniref:LIM zinc-binding domain-containing protein n=1 Tax=Aegilops tauschii subsp. strangulata TaxID=200361 RepID=A0A452XCY2_AEGTS